jgi:protein-S-isoprenylcysteine O-methyltransferase Ste14
VATILDLKIPPVALFLVCAVVMWALAAAYAGAAFVLPGAAVAFAVCAALGGVIGIAGVSAFRRHSTTVDPTAPDKTKAIVTDSIYRYSRNPMYLALFVTLAGWGLFLQNVAALAVLPVFVVYMTQFQIKPEELVLLARFGPDYDDYMAAVRRWI